MSEFQDLPEATQVETPFGMMVIHHMCDEDNRSVRIDCDGMDSIVVNNVGVNATLHLTDYGDGMGFVARKDGSVQAGNNNDFHALYAWRSDYSGRDVSDAAKKKLRATLPPIVNAWAADKGGEFASAARATISNEITGLQEGLVKAEGRVEKMKAEIAAKEEALAAIEHFVIPVAPRYF